MRLKEIAPQGIASFLCGDARNNFGCNGRLEMAIFCDNAKDKEAASRTSEKS